MTLFKKLFDAIQFWLWMHMDHYERLELHHFGDPVAKTGLYADRREMDQG